MLKELIQKDFIESMKLKQERKKLALSRLKTKITEAEKLNGNVELSDDEIIKVVTKAVKQREESYKIYVDAGRTELAENEKVELDTLKLYLPKQMSIEEITTEVQTIPNDTTIITDEKVSEITYSKEDIKHLRKLYTEKHPENKRPFS